MKNNLTQKLEIVFDKYSNAYELWLRYFDNNDLIYPLQHSYILTSSDSVGFLMSFAKTHYLNLPSPVILSYSKEK